MKKHYFPPRIEPVEFRFSEHIAYDSGDLNISQTQKCSIEWIFEHAYHYKRLSPKNRWLIRFNN